MLRQSYTLLSSVTCTAGNSCAAAAHGSAPSHLLLHVLLRNTSTWHVVAGATQLTPLGPEVQVRQIKQLWVHEHYMPGEERNNIALLKLDQPVVCNRYVQLGCVPDTTLKVSELEACYIAGWGTTSRGGFTKGTHALRANLVLREMGWASQQQSPKPESDCRMSASGAVVLDHSPKPDRRGKAEQHGISLGNPREALGTRDSSPNKRG